MVTVLRAALTYLFLFIVLRAIGKKELSGMSAFELVMVVIMGDLVQQGVTQQDNSLTAAFLAVGTIAVIIVLASYIGFRFQRESTVTDGLPVVVIRDGKILRQISSIERLTEDEIKEEARCRVSAISERCWSACSRPTARSRSSPNGAAASKREPRPPPREPEAPGSSI